MTWHITRTFDASRDVKRLTNDFDHDNHREGEG